MALQMKLRQHFVLIFQKHAQCYSTAVSVDNKTKNLNNNVKPTGQVANMGKSLAAKGFLRSTKEYTPPLDVEDKIKAICETLQLSSSPSQKLSNLELKFKFLKSCFEDFQHSVPNSQVHELNTVGDVLEFYRTVIDTTVPYDALKNIDLPENLHIQYDYVRFHPDTDTKFNGQTAFPKSSTLVTGLKYRKKYQGYEAKRSWP